MQPACVRTGYGDSPPKVSVVAILCDFNQHRLWVYASQCIRSIREYAPQDAEIILVANEPSEALQQKLKDVSEVDDRIITISMNKNLGVVAKNLGYNVAQGQYIFSMDSDVQVKDYEAFNKCIKYLDGNPQTALVGPCGGRLLERVWARDKWCVGEWDDCVHIFGYDDPVYFGDNEEVDGTKVDTIPSMFWCFRSSLLKQIGGLDWRFGPFIGSDTDFCFRIKEAGHEVRVLRVPVTHQEGGGSSHTALDADMEMLRTQHLAELYDRWRPKLNIIGEYHKR